MNAEVLRPKLPFITGWIDQILAAHANEACPVADFEFNRLPSFYTPDLLQRTKVVPIERLPVPRLMVMGLPEFSDFERGQYGGITFKDTYFLKITEAPNESMYFHELVHVIQWAHLGVDRFLLAYASGLAAYGYRQSPLEVMAYDLQNHFNQHGKPLDVETVARNKLNDLYF